MASDPRSTLVAITLALLSASKLSAQTEAFVATAGYESPDLVLPGFAYLKSAELGQSEWRLGLFGTTLESAWLHPSTRRANTGITVAITPWSSHASRYVYVNGKRDSDAGYDDATFEIRGTIERDLSRAVRLRTSVSGLYESVSGLGSEVESRWSSPFAGVAIAGEYRDLLSDDPLRLVWDGTRVSAAVEAYGGKRFWWRGQAFLGVGRKLGKLHVIGRGFVFGGGHLDIVSAFLVGSSWEYPGVIPLPGYRFDELRIRRGFVLTGGADIFVSSGWEVGARSGWLESPHESAWGVSARVRRIWNGIAVELGGALPDSSFRGRGDRHGYLFAGVAFGLLEPSYLPGPKR